MILHYHSNIVLKLRKCIWHRVSERDFIPDIPELILKRHLKVSLPLRKLVAESRYKSGLAQLRQFIVDVLASLDPALIFQRLLSVLFLVVTLRVD